MVSKGLEWIDRAASTKLVRNLADAALVRYSHHRTRQFDDLDVALSQQRTLMYLTHRARNTTFGRDHDFAGIRSIADYQVRVPLRDYEQYWKDYLAACYPRLQGVTWPDHVPYYALSSGTTTGATKYIPITKEMLLSNRRAAFTSTALFRHGQPKAGLFTGKMFFLGGSTVLNPQADGSFSGDLSGISMREVPSFVRAYTFPTFDLATITNWEEKIDRLAAAAIHEPIAALTGIPAWVLVLFERLKRLTGKDRIIDIFPNLRLVVHGGTKFDPYRELFRREIGSDLVHFQETYPCSEGFIAAEDPRHPGLLRLMVDHGIFYEFIPVDELERDRPTRHTVETLELGVQYAVVLTTCAGLFSYVVGDTVAFESRDPFLLRFTGRTKYFLSAFGEHLISEEVEKAVTAAAEASGVFVIDFHVGPIFPTNPKQPGHHRYLIEFREPPRDMDAFNRTLDKTLCDINEDYAAHRVGDLTMLAPEIIVVPPGGFKEWMASRGKLGGQNKVPRMDNNGTVTQELSAYMAKMAAT